MKFKIFEALAIFYKDDEGYYQVFSPNVDGAISYGETFEDARRNIKEALEGVAATVLTRNFANCFRDMDFNEFKKKLEKNQILERVAIDAKIAVAISLRLAREKSGYTQNELARKAGIKQQAISRYERGLVSPSVDKFIKLMGKNL